MLFNFPVVVSLSVGLVLKKYNSSVGIYEYRYFYGGYNTGLGRENYFCDRNNIHRIKEHLEGLSIDNLLENMTDISSGWIFVGFSDLLVKIHRTF